MRTIFHVYENGDWLVESPYATGSDFGPGGYIGAGRGNPRTEKEFAERRQLNLEWFAARGAVIKDRREQAA